MKAKSAFSKEYNLICVGGGIMSATLALMLKLIDSSQKILILEQLEDVALESSAAWNNAGTGHSAFCELNYSPQQKNGNIDVSKAIQICTQFEQSKQFWAYLVENNFIENAKEFIHPVPHHSFVKGEENVAFLRKRYSEMKKHIMFQEMQFSEDPETLAKWFPIIMADRVDSESVAATRMELGTEINFEKLTHLIFKILEEKFDTPVYTNFEVEDIDPTDGVDWLVEIKNLETKEKINCDAEHVFIGAGGGALSLLQKVEIHEKDGYGGFPVSGQWLICNNREIIEQYHAKVYGKAGVDAPPMSVPHLDTRYIDGKRELLFGPFAGFSTKFLKEGSYLDLFKSIKWDNIPAMWGVFWHNIPLTTYLVKQIRMTHEDRMNELRKFVKNAKSEDWDLRIAGQRVQIIKRDEEEGGTLEFGTEVVHSKKGRITALLGASPGASTAVHIMIGLLHDAFPEKAKTKTWQQKFSEMIPFWNKEIEDNPFEFEKVRKKCAHLLQIN
ncbi:malate dehydrogenase (quinone) [Aequorivita viscosa]|nr:malate dehydrogenase (quinone) [Aequorivita viscosa]